MDDRNRPAALRELIEWIDDDEIQLEAVLTMARASLKDPSFQDSKMAALALVTYAIASGMLVPGETRFRDGATKFSPWVGTAENWFPRIVSFFIHLDEDLSSIHEFDLVDPKRFTRK
jgi:hypothetical protein